MVDRLFLRTQKPLFKWDVTRKCRARKHMEDRCSGGKPSPGPLTFPQESQEIRQSLRGLQNTTVRHRRNAEVHKGQLIFSKSHSKFAWELVIRQWPAAARPNNWIINVLSVSCGWGLCLVSSGIIYSPDVPCGAIFTTISQMKRWSLPHLGITFQGAVVKCWAQEA